MNLFRLVHFESYQRGSLAAIRYTACLKAFFNAPKNI
jgi:hypothetical protein